MNERNDFFCFLLVLMKLAFTVNCINEASFKVPPRSACFTLSVGDTAKLLWFVELQRIVLHGGRRWWLWEMYVEFQKGKRPLICGLYGLWVHWCLHNLNIGIGSGLILPCEMTSFKWELQLLIFPHSRCYSGAVIASIVSEWNNGCVFITLQCRNGSRVIVRLLILVEN